MTRRAAWPSLPTPAQANHQSVAAPARGRTARPLGHCGCLDCRGELRRRSRGVAACDGSKAQERVSRLASNMRPIVLRGHTRPVTSLVFSKEGDLLFSGSTDKSISAWYADNGERLGTYIGHNGMVTSVDVSHDTTILASGAGDGEARLWDVRSGACTRVLKHSSKVTSVAFSLGSQYLLTANDPWKGTRTSIQVYDVSAIMSGAAPEPIAQFVLPFECKVKRAAWGPLNDSIYLACDDGFVRRFTNPIQVSASAAARTFGNGRLTIAQDGPDTEQMRPPAPRRMDEPDFKSPCTDMTFSYDRTRFIVTSTDQTAKLYDAYAIPPPPPPRCCRSASSRILCVSAGTHSTFSPPSRATARFTPPPSPPTAATKPRTTSSSCAAAAWRRPRQQPREDKASLRRCFTTRCTAATSAASSRTRVTSALSTRCCSTHRGDRSRREERTAT